MRSERAIGPKAMGGYTAVDNGYARFDHVRIPRDQMLSAFASVTPEGEYIKPSHAKLSYGGVSCNSTLSAFDSLMTSTDAVYSLWVRFVSALDTLMLTVSTGWSVRLVSPSLKVPKLVADY